MATLIYSAITSLDGYVADEEGKFDWAAPDDEVHAFVKDLERPIGTYLYGRRMYETMVFWETVSTGVDQPPAIRDFAEIRSPPSADPTRNAALAQALPRPGPPSSGSSDGSKTSGHCYRFGFVAVERVPSFTPT